MPEWWPCLVHLGRPPKAAWVCEWCPPKFWTRRLTFWKQPCLNGNHVCALRETQRRVGQASCQPNVMPARRHAPRSKLRKARALGFLTSQTNNFSRTERPHTNTLQALWQQWARPALPPKPRINSCDQHTVLNGTAAFSAPILNGQTTKAFTRKSLSFPQCPNCGVLIVMKVWSWNKQYNT